MEPDHRRAHDRRNGRTQLSRAEVNRQIAILTIISIACAFLLASFFPHPVFLPMLATLLCLSAMATVLLALLMAQPIFARTFTFWDKAAALFLLSLAANLAADQEAARQFLEAQTGTQTPITPQL